MIYKLFRIETAQRYAGVAQKVERILGKDEVTSSNLVISSKKTDIPLGCPFSLWQVVMERKVPILYDRLML